MDFLDHLYQLYEEVWVKNKKSGAIYPVKDFNPDNHEPIDDATAEQERKVSVDLDKKVFGNVVKNDRRKNVEMPKGSGQNIEVLSFADENGKELDPQNESDRKKIVEQVKKQMSEIQDQVTEQMKLVHSKDTSAGTKKAAEQFIGKYAEMSTLRDLLDTDVPTYLLPGSTEKSDLVTVNSCGNANQGFIGFVSVKSTRGKKSGTTFGARGADAKPHLATAVASAKNQEIEVSGRKVSTDHLLSASTNLLGRVVDRSGRDKIKKKGDKYVYKSGDKTYSTQAEWARNEPLDDKLLEGIFDEWSADKDPASNPWKSLSKDKILDKKQDRDEIMAALKEQIKKKRGDKKTITIKDFMDSMMDLMEESLTKAETTYQQSVDTFGVIYNADGTTTTECVAYEDYNENLNKLYPPPHDGKMIMESMGLAFTMKRASGNATLRALTYSRPDKKLYPKDIRKDVTEYKKKIDARCGGK